jgi:tetratricopeptide (TPR) repeat protein/DNA-binding CsgD family transcriptional regulator
MWVWRNATWLLLQNISGFLLILIMLNGCGRSVRYDDQTFKDKLSLADSVSHIKPETADSIYRWLIQHPSVNQSRLQTSALIGLASGFSNKGNQDSARIFLNRAFRQARNMEDTLMILRCYLESGNQYLEPGQFDKAEIEFNLGLNYAKRVGNPAYQEKFLLSLASIKVERGDYPGAIKIYMLGLKMAEDQKNRVSEAFALEQIGLTLSKTNDLEEAISYMQRAISLRQSLHMNREVAGALQNLGIIYRRVGKAESAMTNYKEALAIYTQLGDSGKMIMVKYNMGVILKNSGKYELARKELEEVLSASKRLKIIQGQMYAYTTLADIFHKTGQTVRALECADSAIFLAGIASQRSNLAAFHERKAEILLSDGNYKEAYEQLQKTIAFNDNLLSEEKHKEVTRLKIIYETDKKDAEIKYLQVDNQYKTTRLRLLIILILSGLVILMLISLLIWLRIKRLHLQNDLAEEKNLRMQEARKREKTEMEQLELKTRMQEQELVYKTLVEADLMQMNRSVKEKLTPFRMKISRKSDQEEFSQVVQDLTRDSHRDPMAQFDILFKELHPGFYENLITDFPDLTSSELQICALIRLNFSSKDIARLLSLSVATIETVRSHIRKKFNLEVKDNLSSYLMAR